MDPKTRVEALRVERGNLEELSKAERIERAFESVKRYYEELLHPLISSAQIEDYTTAINETLDSLEPDEKDVVRARLEPVLLEGSLELAERSENDLRRVVYLEQMRGATVHEIIDRVGGLQQLERLVGSEETERLRKKAEKEE